jgi:hypothetical protein
MGKESWRKEDFDLNKHLTGILSLNKPGWRNW